MDGTELHLLIVAIIVITSALIFYTIGVWAERLRHELLGWHVMCFLLGITADLVGTSLMAEMARLIGHDDRLHEITGIIAVALMGIHALWAIYTLRKGSAKAKRNFSRFSVVVWVIWLVPYLIGVYLGMSHHLGR